MIYILYSGDYEVFMGGNYLPEEQVVIETTTDALDVFNQMETPVTLFADLPCLWRYRELGLHEFPDQVENQLKHVIARGHDVQTHIHPHWSRTEIDRRPDGTTQYNYDHKWVFLGGHYGDLHSFMLGQLRQGKDYLESLLCPVTADYRCIAYRAGAYCLSKDSASVIAALDDAGYLIDSSVVPGLSGAHVDYSSVPRLPNYRLSRKWGVERAADKGIFEIPVGATKVRGAGDMLRLKFRSARRRLFHADREHINRGFTAMQGLRMVDSGAEATLSQRLLRNIRGLFSTAHWGMLELEADPSAMFGVTRSYLRQFSGYKGDVFFSVNFHPKTFDDSKAEALHKFHSRLKRHYGGQLKAITFREAADLLPEVVKK